MKQIILRHVLLFAFALVSTSCTHQQPKFLGKWKCDVGLSGNYFWVVEPDRVTGEFQDDQIEFEYTLNRSHNPHWLNIIKPDETHLCIIEFLDADTFRVTGLDGDGERPTDFPDNNQTLLFKRVK